MKRADKPSDRYDAVKNLTAKERAFGGEWYIFTKESELVQTRNKASKVLDRINKIGLKNREKAQKRLVKNYQGIDISAYIIFPISIEYSSQIIIGEKTFIHKGFFHLSGGKLTIGKNCFIGPNAHFYTPTHAIEDLELRREGWQFDEPITIGDDVWFGGDVIVCPGVTIGDNVVVGAGSVITKSFPSNVVIGGNPAKIIRELPHLKTA